jgi:uncharacterized membrane protein YeaQ/YmgE (transglycosylase-associated protein family)
MMDSLRAFFNDTESLVILLLVGLIAGWLAGQLIRGRGFGMLLNIVIGVIGAYLGGIIFRAVGVGGAGMLWMIVSATVGALVLVFFLNALRR